eukprot:gb/GFBE01016347.1/.p1 GENE.gb/GFBE01016347.1/~~gb/GFBE01016347.1/.p1  ORF type:complete len:548 (+),score=129.65 gb/GFBE01016347.1/:1-1644(+)
MPKLSACLLGLVTTLGAAEVDDLSQRISSLERLVASESTALSSQKAQYKDLEDLLARANSHLHKDRRLAADGRRLATSIHGDNTVLGFTEVSEADNIAGALDHIWLILCGALVMFMQAGFAMVESGCCRAKNVQNILLKNLTDVCMGTIGWWLSGWAFAYSGPYDDDGALENKFMGYSSYLGSGFLVYRQDGMIEPTTSMLNWFFQWAFCSAAATIVSGGVAERCNFPAYCIYSLAMTGFIYPVVVAWTWGYGWLSSMNSVGYMDFAGSGIVHMCGGVAALVGAIISGPRTGRWTNPEKFDPHSLPLIVLGTFILFFGWYGFNCGSTLSMASIERGMMAAQVAMNTTISAATGGLTVFILRLVMLKKYDIGGFCNGILAGLVSITAPCGNVECGSAFAIGLLGAFFYQGASSLMRLVKVDDPIDAFAVHGVCGMWGTLAAALFDWGEGFDHFHGWSGFSCIQDADGACLKGVGGEAIAANLAEIVTISLWTASCSAFVLVPLRLAGFLRASDEVQDAGFDAMKHSPSKAYALEDNKEPVTPGEIVSC